MRRGFTLIEMSIVVSILAVLVPLIFMFGRSFQDAQFEAAAQVEAAAAMRAVSEELRRDLKTMAWLEDSGLQLAGAGACKDVEYRLTEEHRVVRKGGEGCGPERVIAANVRAFQREAGGLRVVFFKRVSTSGRERVDSFFMGFGE